MRIIAFLGFMLLYGPSLYSQTNNEDSFYIFNFSIELELTNDQGEMGTGDYLKQYGTKGKTRALDDLYPMMDSCFSHALGRKSIAFHPFKDLSDIRSNNYGYPSMTLKKAIKSGRGKQYCRISLKDIGFVNPEQARLNSNQLKVVEMRCRIQLYDEQKNLLKTSEAKFATGDKLDPRYNIGVDLRRFQGSGRTQELKFYEVCCKMAFFKALESF